MNELPKVREREAMKCHKCVHAQENQPADSVISDFTYCEECKWNPNLRDNFQKVKP